MSYARGTPVRGVRRVNGISVLREDACVSLPRRNRLGHQVLLFRVQGMWIRGSVSVSVYRLVGASKYVVLAPQKAFSAVFVCGTFCPIRRSLGA